MKPEIKQRIEQINNGQVPDGYKKTEFGVFPCDWVTDKTFGDLFTFNGGLGKSREELSENGVEYLHYGDMHRADFNLVSLEQYSKLPKCNTQVNGDESYLMQDGDVAFLDASEDLDGTSRAVLIDNPENKPFIAGLHIIYGKSTGNELSKYYKQYITRPEYVKKQFQKLASGFKVYGLNRNTIAKIKYAYPADTKEQEKIAEILMKWDEAIELQEKYIEKLESKQKALMYKLLMPKNNWKSFKLGDVCSIKTGKLDVNATCKNGCYPFFSCSKEVYAINTYSFNCEALLIAGNGDIGDIKYYNGKFDAYQRTYVLSDFNFDIKYIMQYLLFHFDKEVLKGIQKSSMPYIKLNSLKTATIKYDESEYLNIRNLLIKHEEIISKNIILLNQLIEQRKALQQYLLNGIVRVNDEQ